jgi:4-cresol dehydrogenase (hydroxylating)
MGTPTLTEDIEYAWPARFGSWAERAPDTRALCRSVRSVAWRLRPPTPDDVRAVVREAAAKGSALWPVSRGCNWGYGSHLPARNGSIILDLCRLESIGDLDRPSLSVRIEPGVTQRALYEYLQRNAPDLAFNVTGAGLDTSVLGNALERGIGYNGEKDRDVFALEVLLPDGTSVGPVCGLHSKSRATPAGFSTDALFFQSNFGIVVGGRIRLRIRQEAEDAIVIQGPFESVIDTLKRAYDRQLLVNPTHVAEPGRTQRLGYGLLRMLLGRSPKPREVSRCFPEQSSYNGIVAVYGRRRVVDACWREMRRAAGPGVKLTRGNAGSLAAAAKWLARVGARNQARRLVALRPILGLTLGEPTDAGLASLDGYEGGNPDLAACGAIYGNAVSAMGPGLARQAEAIVKGHWRNAAFTWIIVDSRCMITIYTLHFGDDEAAAVHGANASIIRDLRSAGFPQYRLDVNTRHAGGSEAIVRRVKAALDPGGIIAPGRYEA